MIPATLALGFLGAGSHARVRHRRGARASLRFPHPCRGRRGSPCGPPILLRAPPPSPPSAGASAPRRASSLSPAGRLTNHFKGSRTLKDKTKLGIWSGPQMFVFSSTPPTPAATPSRGSPGARPRQPRAPHRQPSARGRGQGPLCAFCSPGPRFSADQWKGRLSPSRWFIGSSAIKGSVAVGATTWGCGEGPARLSGWREDAWSPRGRRSGPPDTAGTCPGGRCVHPGAPGHLQAAGRGAERRLWGPGGDTPRWHRSAGAASWALGARRGAGPGSAQLPPPGRVSGAPAASASSLSTPRPPHFQPNFPPTALATDPEDSEFRDRAPPVPPAPGRRNCQPPLVNGISATSRDRGPRSSRSTPNPEAPNPLLGHRVRSARARAAEQTQ
ncbi:basic salivary proline-rich protein 1-like [Sorex fumeus]|uniref:basic salivary proline-rich protein 1-like n=1 Tax=Sorex fumeus TaxID=62283 RepID=UPI0024AE302A|nr:basic salivary proline-rich protein 1-like [Sorex fumeus]